MIAHNFNKCGICIYAKPHISITVLDYTYDFQEYIWCSVSLSKGEHFLLCCIYISPSCADANDLKLCTACWKMYYTLIIVIQLLLATSILDALSRKQNRQS